MATLFQTIDGDHYYLLSGPSKGTQHIEPAGLDWLRKQYKTLPRNGGSLRLKPGEYQYLKEHNYLYIEGTPYEKNNMGQPCFAPQTPDIEQGGPALLLYRDIGKWTLCLKLDEIDTKGQAELKKHKAVAIGTQADVNTMVQLNVVHTHCTSIKITNEATSTRL